MVFVFIKLLFDFGCCRLLFSFSLIIVLKLIDCSYVFQLANIIWGEDTEANDHLVPFPEDLEKKVLDYVDNDKKTLIEDDSKSELDKNKSTSKLFLERSKRDKNDSLSDMGVLTNAELDMPSFSGSKTHDVCIGNIFFSILRMATLWVSKYFTLLMCRLLTLAFQRYFSSNVRLEAHSILRMLGLKLIVFWMCFDEKHYFISISFQQLNQVLQR